MSERTIQCEGCGESRPGRDAGDGVEPVDRACPECGSVAWVMAGQSD